MKWIKASERLPELNGLYYVKRNAIEPKGCAHFHINRPSNKMYWDTEIIEWLDETSLLNTGKADEGLEAVGFAEWIRDERYIQSTRNPNKWYEYPYKEDTVFYTTTQLYSLFNKKRYEQRDGD